MKIFIVLTLGLLYSGLLWAAANDIVFTQRNSTDTGTFTRFPIVPVSTPGVLGFNINTVLPEWWTLGPGLQLTGTVLDVVPSAGQVNSDWNASSGVAQILNKPTQVSAFTNDANYVTSSALSTALASYVTSATLASTLTGYATTSALSSGLSTKYNQPTGTTSQYVRGDGSLATFPTTPAKAFSPVTRALNTCFQPSATRDTVVNYGVEIATTSTLIAGGVGAAILETFSDNACTTGTQEVARVTNGNVQTLGLTVTMTQTFSAMLSSVVQAGQWVKIRTSNVTGTPTFTARPGLEVAF